MINYIAIVGLTVKFFAINWDNQSTYLIDKMVGIIYSARIAYDIPLGHTSRQA